MNSGVKNRSRMRIPVWTAAIVMLVVALVGLDPVSSAEKQIPDVEITRAVRTSLMMSPDVSEHMIDVETEDGVVILAGSIDNMLGRDQAARIAEGVRGVRSVVNRIEVLCVVRPDSEIRRDVLTALGRDPATEAYEIVVVVEEGMVEISGSVESWAEREIASKVVKGVRGVRGLENRLEIEYEGMRTDEEIAGEIRRRLDLDPQLYGGLVEVEVNGGRVALGGVVGSAAQKALAERDAWVTGVTEVDASGLSVEWWAREDLKRASRMILKTDAEIEGAVRDAWSYDPRVPEDSLSVDVEEQVAYLDGTVDNLTSKRWAGRDARNTIGVVRVRNLIRVRPSVTADREELGAEVERALLADPLLEDLAVTVLMRNRKVYLYGKTDTHLQMRRAEDAAASVPGVVEVENNLEVRRSETWKCDGEIKQDIEDQLQWSFFVDPGRIQVTVKDGIATLTGAVSTWQELTSAVENAFEGGAEVVRSRLVVADMPDYRPTFRRTNFNRPLP
jgi:osmotically-inducible protein OsmY